MPVVPVPALRRDDLVPRHAGDNSDAEFAKPRAVSGSATPAAPGEEGRGGAASPAAIERNAAYFVEPTSSEPAAIFSDASVMSSVIRSA